MSRAHEDVIHAFACVQAHGHRYYGFLPISLGASLFRGLCSQPGIAIANLVDTLFAWRLFGIAFEVLDLRDLRGSVIRGLFLSALRAPSGLVIVEFGPRAALYHGSARANEGTTRNAGPSTHSLRGSRDLGCLSAEVCVPRLWCRGRNLV